MAPCSTPGSRLQVWHPPTSFAAQEQFAATALTTPLGRHSITSSCPPRSMPIKPSFTKIQARRGALQHSLATRLWMMAEPRQIYFRRAMGRMRNRGGGWISRLTRVLCCSPRQAEEINRTRRSILTIIVAVLLFIIIRLLVLLLSLVFFLVSALGSTSERPATSRAEPPTELVTSPPLVGCLRCANGSGPEGSLRQWIVLRAGEGGGRLDREERCPLSTGEPETLCCPHPSTPRLLTSRTPGQLASLLFGGKLRRSATSPTAPGSYDGPVSRASPQELGTAAPERPQVRSQGRSKVFVPRRPIKAQGKEARLAQRSASPTLRGHNPRQIASKPTRATTSATSPKEPCCTEANWRPTPETRRGLASGPSVAKLQDATLEQLSRHARARRGCHAKRRARTCFLMARASAAFPPASLTMCLLRAASRCRRKQTSRSGGGSGQPCHTRVGPTPPPN